MDFTERMLERNRSRYGKNEVKENTSETPNALKEVHRNTVTTTTSTSVDIKKHYSGSDKVTIETTVTMRKIPKMTPKPQTEVINEDETTCTESTESDSTEEKENDCSQEVQCPLRHDTKSRLQRLGVLYSDPARLSSPIHRTEDRFATMEEAEPVKPNAKSSARRARLAALAQNINTWEDDVRHHTFGERSGLKSPTKPSVLTKHAVYTDKQANEQHRRFISPQRGNTSPNKATLPLKKKVSPRNVKTENSTFRRQTTPEKPVCSILKRPSDKRTSPQNKNAKSTKSIVWDRTVLDSLEAQGFTRSESSQRLIYNYDAETKPPSPVKGASASTKTQSPGKKSSGVESPRSPFRASPTKVKSPLKATSPEKARYGSPTQPAVEVPTMGVKQLRSPRKAAPAAATMAAAAPSGSVLDRAHRYEQATSPTKRRDPAELPLAERLALFERNAGHAVLPKAPFGMPVPASKLNTGEKKKPFSTSYGLLPKVQAPAQPPMHQSAGSSSSLHDRVAVFEKGAANAEKGHMKGILSERENEIEMLKHRWDRYKGAADSESNHYEPSAPPPSPPPPPPMPSPPQPFDYGSRRNSYYCEEEEEEFEEEQENMLPPLSPPKENPKKAYPVLKDVKKIKLSPPKPGCIYPCLSDLEAESSSIPDSEVEEHCNNNRSTSSESSIESDVNSLGQHIVNISRTSLKRDWSDQSGSEEHVINEIDDFLDEALDDSSDESTPPKRTSYSNNAGTMQSRSFEYSNSRDDRMESSQPLLHTVSFYRKQQNMNLKPPSPARHVHIDPSAYSTDDSIERMEEELDRELKLVEEKIDMLQQEVRKQAIMISQSSQALNLCYSRIEFTGSTEQLEYEKVLLVATQRRQAAQHEIQRLRVEQTLRPVGPANQTLTERGSLTLSDITVPLKMDVIHQAAKEDQCYYLLCLVHSDERVLATQLMSAPRSLRNHNRLTFPDTLTLDGLYSDFKVTVEVYTMAARNKELIPHDVKYHINTNKKDASKLKLTPRKGKADSRLLMPAVQSPGGPGAVRTSTFTRAGYVIFSLREINRTQFALNKNAYTSVLEGSLHLKINSEMCMDVEYRGFLTMFEDVSGFGMWHRRWCLLKGDKLSYWKYPEDECKKVPLDTIDLTACTTTEVDVVPRDVCARPHTFQLEITRQARNTDIASLVLVRNGNKTIMRHLLSADTKDDRMYWCRHLNKALALMRAWGVTSSN